MKNIIYLLIAALSSPSPIAFASTGDAINSANCDVKKGEMIPDGVSKSPEDDKKLCAQNGMDKSQCEATHKKIRETSDWLKTKMTSYCQLTTTAGNENSGTAEQSQKGVARMSTELAKSAGEIRDKLKEEVQHLEDYRKRHIEGATKEAENLGSQNEKTAEANRVKEIDRKSEISKSNLSNARSYASRGTSNGKKVSLALGATVQATHAITVWKEAIKDFGAVKGVAEQVAGQSETNADKTKSESGLGLGLKDMIPLLAAAAPLAALMMNKQNQASNSSGLSDPSLTNPTTTTPTDTTQKSPEANRDIASTNTPQGTPTTAEFTATSTSPNGAEFGQVSTPVSPSMDPSNQDNAASMLGKFDGALGSSPFSGSSTSIPGGSGAGGSLDSSGGSSGASSGKNGIADILKAAEHGDYVAGGGGGAAAFGGGSLGSDPNKDLLKGGDPFAEAASLAGDETFPAVDGMGLEGAHGELGSAVPGADDSRSLFSRVRDYHRRCLKRGCVTGEQGSKI